MITNAICALAAVHNYLMRQVAGHQVEDWQGANSLPRRFFDFANSQIEASRKRNGWYTATDATAALQFVSFSLFVGGHSGWELALKVAGDWYETTPVTSHEQPLRAMWELDNTSKFASRIFLWFDILSGSSISFNESTSLIYPPSHSNHPLGPSSIPAHVPSHPR